MHAGSLVTSCLTASQRRRLVWVGDVAQLVQRRTGTPLAQVRLPGAAGDFSPRVNFRCRLSYAVRTPPCAITCINICAHVRDPVVHVRVWWIMETLKHPPCTVGWVARLSQLAFPREGNLNFPLEKLLWDNTVVKSEKLKKKKGKSDI